MDERIESTPAEAAAPWAQAADRVLLYIRLRLGAVLRARFEPADVLQETLVAAWRIRERFEDRGPGSLTRWLCRIAETTIAALAEREGAAKRTPVGKEEPISVVLDRVRADRTGPATAAARAEQCERLAAAIERLPELERQAVLDRFFLGRSFREIAEQAGVAESTARRLVGRATRLLGEDLGE